MSGNSLLENITESNWQVNEENKLDFNSSKANGKKEQETFLDTKPGTKAVLEARVQSLKQAISVLKSELIEEKALWKKEVELMTNLLSSGERYAESEINSDAEVEVKSAISNVIASPETVASSPLIRDYEEKLFRYQGALAQAQAEKRLNIRRQIAANTYRKRLNEVEKLCQEELDKVRETATYLEPLKQIASEWNKPKSHFVEPVKSPTSEKVRRRSSSNFECGGDYFPPRGRETTCQEESDTYEVPVRQIDANLVMDEDASSEIKGKIVLQIGSLPSEVPTICYSAKFD